MDSTGDIFVAGATSSADFPFTAGSAEGVGGFVAKLRGTGRLAFSSLVPRVAGLAANRAGNVYAVGEDVRRIDAQGRTSEIFPAAGGSPAAVALHPAGRLLVVGEVESGRLSVVTPFQASGGGFHDAFMAMYTLSSGGPAVANAASYAGPGLAPGLLAALFGENLALVTATAEALPLPVELANTRVIVRNEGGGETAALLLFVSPTQVNFVVPPEANGEVEIRVVRQGETLAATRTAIEAVAPGLFTAAVSGHGLAAAIAVRVSADGSQAWTPVARCSAGSCEAVPIDPPASGERVILLLFGTGIRGRGSLESVAVTIGGRAATVLAAEPHSQFAGLDQVNVELPANVTSGQMLEIVLAVDGRLANPVALQVR